jgi:hypothetical protein
MRVRVKQIISDYFNGRALRAPTGKKSNTLFALINLLKRRKINNANAK